MKNKIRDLVIILLTFCILTPGCKTHNNEPAKNSSENISSQSSLDEISTEYNYKEVFGNIKIKTIRSQLNDGRPWCAFGISNSGEIFGFTPAAKGKLSQLVLYNLKTDVVETFYTIEDNLQPFYFKFNEDYLSWLEYSPSNEYKTPRIMLYNRKTKEAIEISRSADNLTNVSECNVALGKNYVLWSGMQRKGNTNKNYIYKYDIKRLKSSIFQENAISPIIGNDFIAWIGPEIIGNHNSAVYVQSLKDNNIKKITNGQNPIYIATDGSSIAYSGNDDLDYLKNSSGFAVHNLSLYNNDKVEVLARSKPCYFEFIEMSKNFINWSQDQKARVYYRKKNKMVVLSNSSQDFTTEVSDKYVVWVSSVIKDEMENKMKSMEEGMALTDLHILCVDDIK